MLFWLNYLLHLGDKDKWMPQPPFSNKSVIISVREVDTLNGKHELRLENGYIDTVDLVVGSDGAFSIFVPFSRCWLNIQG